MKPFKFLKSDVNVQNTNNTSSIAIFSEGKHIISTRQDVSRHNNIWSGNLAPFPIFWWNRFDNRYEHLTQGEQIYEGTIGRFEETHKYRRDINTMSNLIIPFHPVLTEIRYFLSFYYQNDITFSHSDMWVTIKYKVFYETI